MPCFQAHKCTPPFSFPPFSESLFVTCHVSKLMNMLLPLPPLQQVIPNWNNACFQNQKNTASSFSPQENDSSFVICHISELINALIPLLPLQSVSPHL